LGQVLDLIQYEVETQLQAGVFPSLGAVEGRAINEKCEPVMDIRLY
jgi:hypothetical protein